MIGAASWAGCVVGLVLAVLALAGGWTGPVAVPLGPTGGLYWACDALSALFALVLCAVGAAAALDGGSPRLPVAIWAMILTPFAADGFTLALCFGLATVASRGANPAARPGTEQAACGVLCLVAVVALLAPPGAPPDLRFAAMRAAAPEGAQATAILLLALLGAASQLAWPARASPQTEPVGAPLSGGVAVAALYVFVRVLLDLCGPTAPGWWAAPLLALGAGAAVLGGLRANAEDDLLAILDANRMGAAGLAVAGLGAALAARDADAPALAALALGGTLLHVVGTALADMLLALCAAAVARGAGTRALSRLGGLIRSMPGVTLGAIMGAASLASLPLTAGFAGRWLVLQSLLALPQIGGIWQQAGIAAVLAAVALGTALSAAAAIRLIGIGFLGRPRTPRTAAAEEPSRRVRLAVAGLAGLCVLLGVWPSSVLLLIRPAVARLLDVDPAGRLLALPAQADGPGYAAPGIAALLALCGVLLASIARGRAGQGGQRVPAWEGGLDEPPPWLPFGDPAAQISAASASQALLQSLGYPDTPRQARLQGMRWAGQAASRLRRSDAGGPVGLLLLLVVGLLLWGAW